MKTVSLISGAITLCMLQICCSPVESADTSEAKVTGAMQKTDNPFMVVVKDEDAKSDWAVKVKKSISEKEANYNLFILFYTRTDPKAEYEIHMAVNLCYLLKNNAQIRNLLPAQIADMIFPWQKGTCEFKASERPIRATAQVNTNYPKNSGLHFPKTTPYQMEVRIANIQQMNDSYGDDYLFKVYFNIGGDINKKKN